MILQRNRPRSLALSARRLAVSAATLSMFAGSLLVAPPLLSFQLTPSGGRTFDHTTRGERTHIRWSEDGRTVETWIRGAVSFDEDHTTVESVSRGGYLKVRERQGLRVRSVRVSPGAGGLTFEYASLGLPPETSAPTSLLTGLETQRPERGTPGCHGSGPRRVMKKSAVQRGALVYMYRDQFERSRMAIC